ncbi:MAG: hypothetical protein NZ809_04110 [Thermodesulfovibrio sp.]|nr:hypothetical protein [Thermodesulfovibrio sp.]
MIEPTQQVGIIHIFKGKSQVPIKLVLGEILLAEILDILPTGTIQLRINERVINAQPQREIPLSKGDKVYVKVEKPLSDGTIPLRVLTTEAEEIKVDLSIIDFLESIFAQKTEFRKADFLSLFKSLLNLSFDSFPQDIKIEFFDKILRIFKNQTIVKDIQQLIELAESKNIFNKEIETLKSFLLSFDESMKPEILKKVINNSGITFEAKLKTLLNEVTNLESLKGDLKFIVNFILKEAKERGYEEIYLKAEQIQRQLEGFQIVSKGFNSLFSFLPILWRELEGGNIALKSFKKEGKDFFSLFVMLNFTDESLCFVVTLLENRFFISFSADERTLYLIKANEDKLKEAFSLNKMHLSSINYVTKTRELIKNWDINSFVSLTV